MIAAVLDKIGNPLLLADLQVPTLLPGQVAVDVRAAGLCGAQIREITGAKGEDRHLPHLLGHEGGGIVIDVGPGVRYVRADDQVVMHWRKGRGIEAECPQFNEPQRNQLVGAGPVATFTEIAIVSENRLTTVNPRLPFDIGALMGCAVTTALGLINNEAKLKIGQSIAIAGFSSAK